MSSAITSRAQCVCAGQSQGQKLRVVPILGPSHEEPSYELLRQQTLASILVTEISEHGSVPELQVQNRLAVRVFLMDGQELVGAKQNRILNTDVLVPANATLKIPVSCVEQGRWHHNSHSFSVGKSASHRTRRAKLSRVYASLKSAQGHDADQQAVWDEVHFCLAASGASSETMALNDAYARREQEFRTFRTSLRMPQEAVGLAVFHGGLFQGLDLFDRHSTLAYFWESLVDSYAMDLLGVAVDPAQPTSEEGQIVRGVLDQVIGSKWEPFASLGEGAEWRVDGDLAAAALVWDEKVVVHLQVFPRADQGQEQTRTYRPRIRRRYGRRPPSAE